ncbi:MAG: hypothetical protein ACREP6_04160 [Candidatus Binataceae bacterium]
MARSSRSKHLQDFIDTIRGDWKGTFRKFPDQTVFALQDERVIDAIEKRFTQGIGVNTVRQLDYDFYTGLQNVIFEFAASALGPGFPRANAFLTILDSNCKVHAVIDPFDPGQPNKFVPPLPQDTEQPFVLDRPSVSKEISLSDAQMYPLQVRSRAFFERLKAGGNRITIEPTILTLCSFQTWSPYGTVPDFTIDDCGEPTILV